MTAGELSKSELWEEYYTNLHKAYNAMWRAFRKSGLSQDKVADRLGVDKGLISKRLKGRENLTLKTLSFMASAMECRLAIDCIPYAEVRAPVDQMSTSVATTAGEAVKIHFEVQPIAKAA
jgi:transcriptional regulator with XRE-family HTH domain